MSVVQVTTREFPRYRRAALAGKEVQVRDRGGNGFVFRSQKAGTDTSLAAAMHGSIGSVASGRPRKAPTGYGRD